MKSCLERCTESVAPSSLAGHLFLLAGLIRGSPVVQLGTPKLDLKDSGDSTHITANILCDIVQYLAQDDLLAVISFGSKAALLECGLVVIRRLEECVVFLRSNSTDCKADKSPSDFVGTEIDRNASIVLLLNTEVSLSTW